ncbi:MAG TPA: exodeoxyribonuclease VII large subunit [Anaerolineales bacterium]|nr:exodeoxyribonuclease VII large subunit [Anaerolineales bacterium]
MQPSLFASMQWTVTTLTRHIRDLLESDAELQDIWVEGEISNLSRPASGHIYFTLKDAGASLRSVMWKTGAARLTLSLQDGMAVAVHGKIGVYEVSGQYQLYVDQIRPVGEGALYQEFLRLKALLEAEGLFDPSRKRPILELPKRIGIVTSATGAALRDMLSAIRRRLPIVEVVLAPAPVQGEDAPPKLVQALALLNHLKPAPDVILLARGGGSIEDLWAFNDERVVRAVSASEAPVICGVGHETDFTLSDFAADLRAPTPTAAAELATPITVIELRENIATLNSQLISSLSDFLQEQGNSLSSLRDGLRFFSPLRRIQSDRQRLDDLARRADAGQVHRLALEASQIEGLGKRLEALSPLKVIARGYAVVTRQKDGLVIRKVAQAKDGIRVRVSDGEFDAQVVDHKTQSAKRKK